jgi:hypothetical protein
VPKGRDRAAYGAAVRVCVLRALPFAALPVGAALLLPHDGQGLATVAFFGLLFAGLLVRQVAPFVTARRWLDDSRRWEEVSRLQWDEASERSQRRWEDGVIVSFMALGAALIVSIAVR